MTEPMEVTTCRGDCDDGPCPWEPRCIGWDPAVARDLGVLARDMRRVLAAVVYSMPDHRVTVRRETLGKADQMVVTTETDALGHHTMSVVIGTPEEPKE